MESATEPRGLPAVHRPARELDRREREILAFEGQWWKYAGAKEQAVRELFDMSPTRRGEREPGWGDSATTTSGCGKWPGQRPAGAGHGGRMVTTARRRGDGPSGRAAGWPAVGAGA